MFLKTSFGQTLEMTEFFVASKVTPKVSVRRIVYALALASVFSSASALAATEMSGLSIENLIPTEGGYEIYLEGQTRPLIIDNAIEFSDSELQTLKSNFKNNMPISLTADGQNVLSIETLAPQKTQDRLSVSQVELSALMSLNENRPYWINPFGLSPNLTPKVAQFLEKIKTLPAHGLRPSHYSFQKLADQLVASQITAMDFEKEFTREVIRLAQDLRSGRVLPDSVTNDIKFRWKGFADWATLHRVITQLPADAWDQLAPKNKFYLEAKNTLNRLNEALDKGLEFEAVKPAPVKLKVGSMHPTIQSVKQILSVLGHDVGARDENFTTELASAIKMIQTSNLAEANGELRPSDAATWEFFSHTLEARILHAKLTLEKTRWLPDTLPAKYMLVNLARQRVQLADAELTMPQLADQKTINGRVDRKTPSMSDKITHVILNPTWTVPDGIFAKDKIPMLVKIFNKNGSAEDVANYLGPHGYRLLSRDLRTEINPMDVDWRTLNINNAQFVIRQDAGNDNALGLVKFQMTNSFNIYMHDTNERHIFSLPYRLRSSGCVRVQHPIDLAEYALKEIPGWDRKRIDETLPTKDKPGQNTWVALPKPIPVYTISMTVHQQGNAILFTRDMYRQNQALFNRLKASGYDL